MIKDCDRTSEQPSTFESIAVELKQATETIAELRLELKILQRAYDQLYQERYGDKPQVVYGHV